MKRLKLRYHQFRLRRKFRRSCRDLAISNCESVAVYERRARGEKTVDIVTLQRHTERLKVRFDYIRQICLTAGISSQELDTELDKIYEKVRGQMKINYAHSA